MKKHFTLGNTDILKQPKTAFFCSQKCPGNVILKVYDLAIKFREEKTCVISGFHTPIEKELLHYLLKGTQPIIICPARGIYKNIPKEHKTGFKNNRTLYISPFEEFQPIMNTKRAIRRNKFIVDLADNIFIAYAHPKSKTESLANYIIKKGKNFCTFDIPENQNLINMVNKHAQNI